MRVSPTICFAYGIAAFCCGAARLSAQLVAPDSAPRPTPHGVLETSGFQRAVRAGTRTRRGIPGSRYWSPRIRYDIAARLEPAQARLAGTVHIVYGNRSPDTLRVLAIHLYQNAHRPDALRTAPTPVSSGDSLTGVAVNGVPVLERQPSDPAPGYWIHGTVAWIRLSRALVPGDSVALDIAWSYRVAGVGDTREGQDGDVFLLGYWYPQLAVYDDVNGWQADPYLVQGEFYMDYADYTVALTVPANWVVAATGTLQNATDVLPPAAVARLSSARPNGTTIHVVDPLDHEALNRRSVGGVATWRYRAVNVRDVAWATSPRFAWDVTWARDSGTKAITRVNAFYRPGARWWAGAAQVGRQTMEFYDRFLWPYAYDEVSIVEGPINDGMEYPMLTFVGDTVDSVSLVRLTVHELGHMWFPIAVGSDEKRFAWMDEGLTTFNTAFAIQSLFRQPEPFRLTRSRINYVSLARTDSEVELMRPHDQYPVEQRAASVASYDKMATVLAALRSVLGDDAFFRAYRAYGLAWRFRHPQPYDFWNSFRVASGRNLDWFWQSWFYERWILNRALGPVVTHGDSVDVAVVDRGLVPMPVPLVVTRVSGQRDTIVLPVEAWLHGGRVQHVRVLARPPIARIALDPDHRFPEVDTAGKTWAPAP